MTLREIPLSLFGEQTLAGYKVQSDPRGEWLLDPEGNPVELFEGPGALKRALVKSEALSLIYWKGYRAGEAAARKEA